MSNYDVIFLHAPKTFSSLRSKPASKQEEKLIESGADPMFCFMPMGMFALASSLHEKGYRVKMINLGIEQQNSESFDVNQYLKSLHSSIYAIDLQWFVHCSSALQTAEICKTTHPGSLTILGGMTATWFSSSILKENPCIDAVLLGEADISLPLLVEAWFSGKSFDHVGGIKYRVNSRINENPLTTAPSSLDNMSYTNLSLLQNYPTYIRNDVMSCGKSKQKLFWLPISRGCPFNCIYCGGSKESYRIFSGRDGVLMRSPVKVAQDIERLEEYGVEYINLSHDPRIGGTRYLKELVEELRKRKTDASVYIEAFALPDRGFIEILSKAFNRLVIAVTPESVHEKVRTLAGRSFSNDQLFRSLSLMRKKSVETHLYFTIGLPGEVMEEDTSRYYKKFIEKLSSLGGFVIPSSVYTIDPNCIMSIHNEKYGVRLFLKTLNDYQKICHSMNTIDWVGHETEQLSRNDILQLTTTIQSYAMKTLNQTR